MPGIGAVGEVETLLDADPYRGMGVNSKSLVRLLGRLETLKTDEPDRWMTRAEREAMMVQGGLSPLTAHRWMDLNPEMYGDIKTVEALNEQAGHDRHGENCNRMHPGEGAGSSGGYSGRDHRGGI